MPAAFLAAWMLALTGAVIRPLQAQIVARAGGLAGVDVVCTGTVRAWTLGAPVDDPLVVFGARGVLPVGLAPSDGLAPLRAVAEVLRRSADIGALAVGPALRLDRGPLSAGASTGDAASGYTYAGPREGRRSDPGARVTVDFVSGPWLVSGDVTAGGGRPTVGALTAGWVGRRSAVHVGALPTRTGPGCAAGLVLGGGAGPVRGVELSHRRGIRIPVLGEVAMAAQIGTLPEAGPGNRHPLFHAMRVELRPSGSLVLGLSRAVIFGGSTSEVPLTPRTVGLMLIGLSDTRGKDSDFENQVAAMDARWRTRVVGRPVRVEAELAADDSGLAFLRVPGVRLAGEARWGPHPDGWTGVEFTWLAPRTGTYPPWYRHGALAWGWTDRGEPLGAALAGQGMSLTATWGLVVPGLAVDLRAGVAHRGPDNLLAPDLRGTGPLAATSITGWRGPWEWHASALATATGALAWRGLASLQRRF